MEPPKVLLCDLGQVVVRIQSGRCAEPVAALFGLDEAVVRLILWGHMRDCNRHYARLERDQIDWRTYFRYCTLLLMRHSGRPVPSDWSLAYFEEQWDKVIGEPIPEVMEILERLAPHVTIASASNTNQRHYDRMLGSEILRFIKEHTPSHLLRCRKGDEHYYRILLRHLGVGAHEAVYIDDVPLFTGQAKREGIRSITLFNHTPDDFAQLRQDLIDHGVPPEWLPPAPPPMSLQEQLAMP